MNVGQLDNLKSRSCSTETCLQPSTSRTAMLISRVLKITDHDMSRTQWQYNMNSYHHGILFDRRLKEDVDWNKKLVFKMLKTALFDCAVNENICSVDGGRGICPPFSSLPREIWQLKREGGSWAQLELTDAFLFWSRLWPLCGFSRVNPFVEETDLLLEKNIVMQIKHHFLKSEWLKINLTETMVGATRCTASVTLCSAKLIFLT